MQIIYKERQEGKTEELIKLSHEHGYYMVVANMKTAQDVRDYAKEMDYNIPYPMTYHEFLTGKYNGMGVKKLLIDDAGLLIKYIAHCPIEAITVTKPEEKSKEKFKAHPEIEKIPILKCRNCEEEFLLGQRCSCDNPDHFHTEKFQERVKSTGEYL